MHACSWLITFRCYGTWLPGDRRGYIEHTPGRGTYLAPPRDRLAAWAERQLQHPPHVLDAPSRAVVEAAVREECRHAGWVLLAVQARTNHVHLALSGNGTPDRMMNALKARATRRLRDAKLLDCDTRPWARHGSTVPLRTQESLERACRYVLERQGAPL